MDRKAFAPKILRFQGLWPRQAQNAKGSHGPKVRDAKVSGTKFIRRLEDLPLAKELVVSLRSTSVPAGDGTPRSLSFGPRGPPTLGCPARCPTNPNNAS
jgi:hypothetical protein